MNSTGLFENAYREIRDQGSKLPWSSTAVTGLLLYAVVCSALRFRRRDAMAKKYHYPTRASLSKMTNDDAQAIGDYIGQLEFPYLYVTALQFSLFKVSTIQMILRNQIRPLSPREEMKLISLSNRHMAYLQFPRSYVIQSN